MSLYWNLHCAPEEEETKIFCDIGVGWVREERDLHYAAFRCGNHFSDSGTFSAFERSKLVSSCRIDNTPYRKEAVMFLLSAPGLAFVDLTDAVRDGVLEGCAVLRYDDESYGMNEVIYCDQDVIGVQGMEMFDFLSEEKVVVAGADSGYGIGDTVTVDSVEGVLERHISMAINAGVFYSYCDLSHVPTQKIYVLTAKEGRRIADAYTELEELVRSRGAGIRSREMSRTRFSDYVDYRGVMILLLGVRGLFLCRAGIFVCLYMDETQGA